MRLTKWQRPELGVWDPFRRLSTLREEIDRLFDSPLSTLTEATQPFLSGWLPAVDVFEDKDNLFVKAEIPAMKKEDMDISLHDGFRSRSGERKSEEKVSPSMSSEKSISSFFMPGISALTNK